VALCDRFFQIVMEDSGGSGGVGDDSGGSGGGSSSGNSVSGSRSVPKPRSIKIQIRLKDRQPTPSARVARQEKAVLL
jgi:hypothetical protein